MFHLGQKVVCIETFDPSKCYSNETLPIKGKVYTIRGIVPASEFLFHTSAGVHLEEIVNPFNLHFTSSGLRNVEQCWDINAFRPLIERRTDIGIFKKMLIPGGKKLENV